MKLFIASDIHGSYYYLEKLIEQYKKGTYDKFVLLGDVLYHGPRNDLPNGYEPKKVISALNELKDNIICVKGNCDAEVDNMVLGFDVTADYLELDYNGCKIFVTHGHKYNNETPPKFKKGDVLLHGHTHVPACENLGEYVYINPGSVSIPKENSWHGYMVFDNGVFTWYDLDGNIKKTFKI
ncbi:MAG: phosphodiesterase [Clostridia bacterium]|nr:phosphodiesterase [Clostridia bacterium]